MKAGEASFGYSAVDRRDKPRLVKALFDQVAWRYDLMNDLMSGGAHRGWKDVAVWRLNPQPGETIIDCAGGTGDMAARLARFVERARRRRGGPAARIVLVDFSEAMMRAGRRRGGRAAVLWAAGDAQRLPVADCCADAFLIAFGLRNVTEPEAALAEARRVLKPGGRFLCLEFSRPTAAALRGLYDAYSFRFIPAIGERVSGNRGAYAYLVESIRRFPEQGALAAMIRAAGFGRVSATNLAGGIAALHQGWAL